VRLATSNVTSDAWVPEASGTHASDVTLDVASRTGLLFPWFNPTLKCVAQTRYARYLDRIYFDIF
jgi:hypothetical protein